MTDDAPQPASGQQRYTAVAIALHWAIALMILGLLAVGWFMENILGDTPADRAQYQSIVQLHKSFGITVLLLSVARIAWRIMNPPPKEPPMPGWQAIASRMVHVLFYIVIIAMPLSGWIMASASGAFETRYFGTVDIRLPVIPSLDAGTREGLQDAFGTMHLALAWVMVTLLVLHVAAALKHQFVDKDGLMARMAPGVFGRTAGPPDDGQGAFWAFGAAALVFAVVAGLSFVGGKTPAAPVDAAQQATEEEEPASSAPAWAVNYEQSRLAFRFTYMGRPYEGAFPEWAAKIQLDTDADTNEHIPADGYVRVSIPLGKVSTGEPYFDDSLTQPDWFDVSSRAEAVFEVKGGVYKLTEREYEATGVLQIKEESVPVRLPFTLDIDGTTATMHGEVTLRRLDLDVGGATLDEPSGDAEWVGNEVTMVIDIVAIRQ